MAFAAEEFEGQTVRALKTLVGNQIGVLRFRQRWLGEDHTELPEDSLVIASDVQLVVQDFVQAEDGEAENLFDACEENLLEQVDELLRKPLNPNVVDEDDDTALKLTAQSGHVECAALLLEAGANIDATDNFGATALHWAAASGHVEVVRLLLEADAKIDAVASSELQTALHWAADSDSGSLEVVRLLLEAGAEKDAKDIYWRTPLHLAARMGNVESVRLLLEAGCDKDVFDVDDLSSLPPLHLAALQGHPEVVQLLLEAGADKDVVTCSGHTALHLAAEYGQEEVKRLLLADAVEDRSTHV